MRSVLGLIISLLLSHGAQAQASRCLDIFAVESAVLFELPTGFRDDTFTQHLQNHRYPEAMRRAQELGHRDVAYRLETFILNSLKNDAPVGLPRYIFEGSTEVYLVTLSSGVRAVFKPNPEHWVISSKRVNAYLANSAAEVAAYSLSRILGLNLVPPTVMRSLDGKVGSLQVFVQGSSLSAEATIAFVSGHRFLSQQMAELTALDYLLRNSDRYEKNILFSEGQLWAIDNGSSLYPMSVRLNRARLQDIDIANLGPSFAANLYATTPGVLREVLRDYPDKIVVEELIQRREVLLNQLNLSRQSRR